jgi:hypothetical protein
MIILISGKNARKENCSVIAELEADGKCQEIYAA